MDHHHAPGSAADATRSNGRLFMCPALYLAACQGHTQEAIALVQHDGGAAAHATGDESLSTLSNPGTSSTVAAAFSGLGTWDPVQSGVDLSFCRCSAWAVRRTRGHRGGEHGSSHSCRARAWGAGQGALLRGQETPVFPERGAGHAAALRGEGGARRGRVARRSAGLGLPRCRWRPRQQERRWGHRPASGGEARARRGGGGGAVGGAGVVVGAEQRRRVAAVPGGDGRVDARRESDRPVQGRVGCWPELAECSARRRLPEPRLISFLNSVHWNFD